MRTEVHIKKFGMISIFPDPHRDNVGRGSVQAQFTGYNDLVNQDLTTAE